MQMGQWLWGLLPRLCLLLATPAAKCLLIATISGRKKKGYIYQKYLRSLARDPDLCWSHMAVLFLYLRFWEHQKSSCGWEVLDFCFVGLFYF